jgi:hypothetical protein
MCIAVDLSGVHPEHFTRRCDVASISFNARRRNIEAISRLLQSSFISF